MKDYRVLMSGNLGLSDHATEEDITHGAGYCLDDSGVDESIGTVLLRDTDGKFYSVYTYASIEEITREEAEEFADIYELEESIDG